MQKGERFQTSIRVSPETWRRLRALAEVRALRVGGRPSMSDVVADLARDASKAKRERADA